MTGAPSSTPSQSHRAMAARALCAVLVVGISVTIFALGESIERLRTWGYLGAFAIMLLGNATVILPAPGLALVFALGSALHPIPLGLASGAGGALGELTGYLAGASGRIVVEKRVLYHRLERWMSRYGSVALLVLAAIPNPFFDLAGLVAGALRYSWWRFLLLAWAGKTAQGILIAYAGAVSAQWVLRWLN